MPPHLRNAPPTPRSSSGADATSAGRLPGLLVRAALLGLLATGLTLGWATTTASGDEHERSRVGELLAPLAPGEDRDAAPPPDEPAEPEPAPEGDPSPAPQPEPAPEEPPPDAGPPPPADPPPGEGDPAEPPPAPVPAEVQASGEPPPDAPRAPTAGSASVPSLQTGEAPADLPDGEVQPHVDAPHVAPPESATREGTDGSAAPEPGERLAAAPGLPGVADGPAPAPELAVLALLALGLAWHERRHRARYRLPPVRR